MTFAPKPTMLLTILFLIDLVLAVSVADQFYPGERAGLLQLKGSLNSPRLADWAGPPCHNNNTRWSGVACSNGHVVHLVLQGLDLSASLPPTFLHNLTFLTKLSFTNNFIYGRLPNLTGLVNLQIVFLSQNHFTGSIPRNYATLPKLRMLELQQNYLGGTIPPFDEPTLTVFNVSYNHLQGHIPNTSALQRFPTSCYQHNSNLCGAPLHVSCPPRAAPPTPQSHKKKRSLKVWNIALITAAAALVPFLAILVFLCYYNKTLVGKETKRPGVGVVDDPERTKELELLSDDVSVFDLDDLLTASAQMLGKGKLGTTYKAVLESGRTVAVKRLKDMNELSNQDFRKHMQLVGKLRHDNLVHVISFYYATKEKLVVYEFLPDGNLFDLLHENKGVGRVALPWAARLSIIKDIAKGLTFLHHSLPSHQAPHGNLKSSNVLVYRDRDSYRSKLSDFGFLPLVIPSKGNPLAKLAVGRSPEAWSGEWKKLTHETDVYCFGIILLEVITGRNPAGGDGGDAKDLSGWVRMVVDNDWSTDILDVEIFANREGHDDMLKLTELALECTHVNPDKRPKMSQVLTRILEID